MDQGKQHSKAKYLLTHTHTHTHTTPQRKRGFPPPPPRHKDLSDQRSDLQSRRGRQENTQIHMCNPVTHTHQCTVHIHQLKCHITVLTHKHTNTYFAAVGGLADRLQRQGGLGGIGGQLSLPLSTFGLVQYDSLAG